jgi:hypothetical protein
VISNKTIYRKLVAELAALFPVHLEQLKFLALERISYLVCLSTLTVLYRFYNLITFSDGYYQGISEASPAN